MIYEPYRVTHTISNEVYQSHTSKNETKVIRFQEL